MPGSATVIDSVLLQREGWQINHKRVRRLYKQEGLMMMRPKRHWQHAAGCRRMERLQSMAPFDGWSMNFMSDELYDGWRIRLMTLVDSFARESLAIEVDVHLRGHRKTEVPARVGAESTLRKTIRVNKPRNSSARRWTGDPI